MKHNSITIGIQSCPKVNTPYDHVPSIMNYTSAFELYTFRISGPGSSVGIATGWSGIESPWGRDFPPI